LCAADLQSVKKANAHFGDDLLSSLLNEPIQGQGLAWSSASKKSYPIPFRVGSFDARHSVKDENRTKGAVETYASKLRSQVGRTVQQLEQTARATADVNEPAGENLFEDEGMPAGIADPAKGLVVEIVAQLRSHDLGKQFLEDDDGAAWGAMNAFIRERLPAHVPESERRDRAFALSQEVFDLLFGGPRKQAWETFKHGTATWVRRKR
jgi:uncharacterized protein